MIIANSQFPPSDVDISISPLGYEVDESVGVLRVMIQSSGVVPSPISGNITTSSGTAGDKQ